MRGTKMKMSVETKGNEMGKNKRTGDTRRL